MANINILILSPLKRSSGNCTTANRIRDYLNEDGFASLLRDPKEFQAIQEFTEFLHKNGIDLVIGLHALHSCAFLKACTTPFILIFGGTDINEYSRIQIHYENMSDLVDKSEYLVAFSQAMVNSILELWPEVKDKDRKLKLIHQGAVTKTSNYNLHVEVQRHIPGLSNRTLDNVPGPDILTFTLIAGIRPVKDPLFLVDAFSDWHECCRPDAYLLIVGPVIDEEFSKHFLEYIKNLPGVVYLGGLDLADTHAAIQASTAVLNSSLSEGNSMAIIEAMTLGTPVIARNIPGNCSLLADKFSGLIYNSPQEFIEKAELLLNEESLRERLVINARDAVKLHNSVESERDAYRNIVKEAMMKNQQDQDDG